jgi:hypothetical protein
MKICASYIGEGLQVVFLRMSLCNRDVLDLSSELVTNLACKCLSAHDPLQGRCVKHGIRTSSSLSAGKNW